MPLNSVLIGVNRSCSAAVLQSRRNGVQIIQLSDDKFASGNPGTSPVCTRYLVNEATIEKVHMILQENPQGVFYLRDELSGWMAQPQRIKRTS